MNLFHNFVVWFVRFFALISYWVCLFFIGKIYGVVHAILLMVFMVLLLSYFIVNDEDIENNGWVIVLAIVLVVFLPVFAFDEEIFNYNE